MTRLNSTIGFAEYGSFGLNCQLSIPGPWFSHPNSWLAKNLLGNWRWVGTYTAESPEYATAQSGTDSNLNEDTAGGQTIINPGGEGR